MCNKNKKDWRDTRDGPMSKRFTQNRKSCKKLLPVGYKGQKYIVTCKVQDENGRMTVGWTDSISGKPLVNCVNKHPSWYDPKISSMPEHMVTS